MENKKLIYRDERCLKDTKNLYNVVRVGLQRVTDGLKEVGITPTRELVLDIVQHFDGRSEKVETIIKTLLEGEVSKIPALKEVIEKKYEDFSNRIKGLGIDAYNRIQNYTITAFYDPNPVKLDRIEIKDGIVSVPPKSLKEIEDECSTYIDSKDRKAIYDKATEVESAIKELQAMINCAATQGLSSSNKIFAIAPVDSDEIGILTYDGEVSLNSENFQFIK